jgi:Ser/Thr protein kinase RdoA (MazF antagonist)
MQDSYAFAWGSEATQFFFELTPDVILEAVEKLGFRCTGRILALNSMENRVYEVSIDLPPERSPCAPSDLSRIVKFYRPGRWSRPQIQEEHDFLADLAAEEIPVVAPLKDRHGDSLHEAPDIGVYYCVYPKAGGRQPDELSDEQLERLGRLMARMHNAGACRQAPNRIRLHPRAYGHRSLEFLLDKEALPEDLEKPFADVVEAICGISEPWFDAAACQRIHGDAHLGNLLWSDQGPFWVDFDDMVQGPPVQDLWLITSGRDAETAAKREILLDAYQSMRAFDRAELRLIEPLRALRYVHFSAWIAKRWRDPAFQRAFDFFGTRDYWLGQIQDLRECLRIIREED